MNIYCDNPTRTGELCHPCRKIAALHNQLCHFCDARPTRKNTNICHTCLDHPNR